MRKTGIILTHEIGHLHEDRQGNLIGTKDIKGGKKIGTMKGHHPSWADPKKFPVSNNNGSGKSDVENPSINQ